VAASAMPLFGAALYRWFGGARDELTLGKLANAGNEYRAQ
jgi:uncharacterized protein (DUF1810 family)